MLIPCAMVAGGAGMLLLGRALGAGERRFLVDFLRRVTEAEPAGAPPRNA